MVRLLKWFWIIGNKVSVVRFLVICIVLCCFIWYMNVNLGCKVVRLSKSVCVFVWLWNWNFEVGILVFWYVIGLIWFMYIRFCLMMIFFDFVNNGINLVFLGKGCIMISCIGVVIGVGVLIIVLFGVFIYFNFECYICYENVGLELDVRLNFWYVV